MAKKIQGYIKLQIPAAKATPAPPVGPALGQQGVNIMGFCKEYNAKTANMAGSIIPVEIIIYQDKSFTLALKTPPATDLLKKAARVPKGSAVANRDKVGKVTRADIRSIAEQKMVDLNAIDLDGAMRMIEGTARSMGITVVD